MLHNCHYCCTSHAGDTHIQLSENLLHNKLINKPKANFNQIISSFSFCHDARLASYHLYVAYVHHGLNDLRKGYCQSAYTQPKCFHTRYLYHFHTLGTQTFTLTLIYHTVRLHK